MIRLGVSCTFLFYSATQELVLLANMCMHNLPIISFLSLTMCNCKIMDTIYTIPPCKIIRSTETITFLVESRLSKIMVMVNATIYPNTFAWVQARIYFWMLLSTTEITINMVKDKFLEARSWTSRIKTWMLERKARVLVDLQTHKGNEI